MNRFLLSLFFLCSAICAHANDSVNFTGTWDDTNAKNISFTLFLTQKGKYIEGYHEAIVLYTRAQHIDSILPKDGKPSITGKISGSKASVKFQSGYSDATGTATIQLKGNKLVWTLISTSSPVHYFPKYAVLSRKNEKQK